jgi:hypothetical protein
MKIRQVPQNITNINADPPDPVSENVGNSVNERMSFNFTESFSEFPQPSALDKMLLPASPRLNTSAVEGDPIPTEMQKEKELKINEDEKTELVMDLQRLMNHKL